MSKIRGKLILLLILYLLMFIVVIIKFTDGLIWRVERATTVGIPLISNQENAIVNSTITQVLETKDTIFLVYGYKSIVQAYSPEGTYLYTLSVYNGLTGLTEIAYSKSNDVLYVSDKRRNMYAFSGEDYLEFIDESRSWDLYTKLKFGRSSPHYSVKAGSVWYTNGEESRRVVSMSAWHSIYQSNVIDSLLFFLLIMIGFVLRFQHPSKVK